MLHALLLGAGVAIATAAIAAPRGLYGLVDDGLVLVYTTSGACAPVGARLDPNELQAQQLSVVDSARGIYYLVGFNATTSLPNIVGLWLANGTVASSARLDLAEPDFVGVGQALLIDSVGRLILGGQRAASNAHLLGYVDPATGAFTLVASLSPTLGDALGAVNAYDPTLDAVLVQFTSPTGADELVVVAMATGNVTRTLVEDYADGLNVQAIAGYDAASASLVGLGIAPGQVARTLVRVSAVALNITVVGNIPKYLIELGPIAALDARNRVLFWMGTIGDDPAGAFFVVGVHVGDASLASEGGPLACEPWSLHFFEG